MKTTKSKKYCTFCIDPNIANELEVDQVIDKKEYILNSKRKLEMISKFSSDFLLKRRIMKNKKQVNEIKINLIVKY